MHELSTKRKKTVFFKPKPHFYGSSKIGRNVRKLHFKLNLDIMAASSENRKAWLSSTCKKAFIT